MSITFPPYLETLLKAYLKRTFYRGTKRESFAQSPFQDKDLAFFAEGAKLLSDFFTTGRGELQANYLNDKKLRAGYLLYFLPLNFCKAHYILGKLPSSFWEKNSFRILDLGAGPGTYTLAFLDLLFCKRRSSNAPLYVEILGIDQNPSILKDAEYFYREIQKSLVEKGFPVEVQFQFKSLDLRRVKPAAFLKDLRFDLILTANFLNELGSARAEKAEYLEKIYSHLSPEGFFVLVDPALQRTTRELMGVRDLLLQQKKLFIYSPCLHDKDCPMLQALGRDWCHFYFSWQEPEFLKKVDRMLANNNQYLKCAYFIFSRKPLSELNFLPKIGFPVYRTISNLMGSKGKSEIVVCGNAGRRHLIRLDKNASKQNEMFAQLKRGDLIYSNLLPVKPFLNSGEYKLEKNDWVKKLET